MVKSSTLTATPTDPHFSFPDFDDLPATTITSVVYSNLKIHGKRLYQRLMLSKYADPTIILRTKQERKQFCEKLPKGEIISIQMGNKVKGCIIRKPRKMWCQVCQLWETNSENSSVMIKINTVTEKYIYHPETQETEILCYCSCCEKSYHPSDLKILAYFRNQVMVYMTTERNLVNLMIFPASDSVAKIKMAGCSSIRESRQIIANLWRFHIYPSGAWAFFSEESTSIRFVFEEGMININFEFHGFIDPEKFYRTWKKLEGDGGVRKVVPGKQSQRSIKINFDRLGDEGVALLEFLSEKSTEATMINADKWPDDIVHTRKKKLKQSFPSIVVFMTSSTLVTGKDYKSLKHYYNFFKDQVTQNEGRVKEVIRELDLDKVEELLARAI